jgi:CelD/BcsL family acetyltransferase involved in cellulose biosynthesis
MSTDVHEIDPLRDSRWEALLEKSSSASIFHTQPWLAALQKTYGYSAKALTTSAPGQPLRNGIVFCEVRSWLTGRRLVSIPFSDHCEPLVDESGEAARLLSQIHQEVNKDHWRYAEIRLIDPRFETLARNADFTPTGNYSLHQIDLRPSLDEIFRGFHKSSIQRRIRHAERMELREVVGNDDRLLQDFFRLFVKTRRRHRLPPQPQKWFLNLRDCLGHALEIRMAYKNDVPVATILSLRFRDVTYYKYAASDSAFNQLGAGPWLLWRAIAAAKQAGSSQFDLGRSDEGHAGLLTFKGRWGSRETPLTYWRCCSPDHSPAAEIKMMETGQRVFALMPEAVLKLVGRFSYRHIG